MKHRLSVYIDPGLLAQLDELAKRKFAGVPPVLRHDIATYYARAAAPLDGNDQKRVAKIREQLAAMNAP